MVEYANGDITEVKHGIICHQVNCALVMGAGLAKQLRRKWPQVYNIYKNIPVPLEQRLGHCQMIKINTGLYVANLFGQFGYNSHIMCTSYEALGQAIQGLNEWHKGCYATLPIYIPYKMGCGLAGGNWDTVQSILFNNLQNYTIVKR